MYLFELVLKELINLFELVLKELINLFELVLKVAVKTVQISSVQNEANSRHVC
jgi:hypothetical protein